MSIVTAVVLSMLLLAVTGEIDVQGEVMPPVPSFLQRGPAPQVAPPPMATNFGMVQQPPATDSALDAAISLALNLGT